MNLKTRMKFKSLKILQMMIENYQNFANVYYDYVTLNYQHFYLSWSYSWSIASDFTIADHDYDSYFNCVSYEKSTASSRILKLSLLWIYYYAILMLKSSDYLPLN